MNIKHLTKSFALTLIALFSINLLCHAGTEDINERLASIQIKADTIAEAYNENLPTETKKQYWQEISILFKEFKDLAADSNTPNFKEPGKALYTAFKKISDTMTNEEKKNNSQIMHDLGNATMISYFFGEEWDQ